MLVRHKIRVVATFASLVAFGYAAVCSAKDTRLILVPRFLVGETLVYDVESQTQTAGNTVTPIINHEGATQSALSIGLRERLEVLSVDRAPEGESVRFRLAWDDAHASASADALDPTASNPAEPFVKLQGRSMEFTLAPNGSISKLSGLEDILPGGVPPIESVEWISSLAAPQSFPSGGIAVGQQWSADRPIAGAPLAGLFWQLQSTYERNEPCPTPKPATGPSQTAATMQPQQCAVIKSEMSVGRRGSAHSDATPEDYLHQGLRTSGTWTGSGAELGSIAIQTGLLMNVTETSSQNVDYEIRSATTGSSIHYMAKVESQTGITLVDESQQPASPGK